MHDVMEQVHELHVRQSVQHERYEMEIQDRVRKHEHVKHVQHDIIVDERMIRMRVRMEHIDEVHDERHQVIVRVVQHEQ